MKKKILSPLLFLFSCVMFAQYPAIEAQEGIHPRIFADNTTFSNIKDRITNNSATLSNSWSDLKTFVDRIGNPPTDKLFRSRGWEIQSLVAAYRFSGERRYLDRAIEIAEIPLTITDWIKGEFDGSAPRNLENGHISLGIAMLYDWAYDDLTPDFRQRLHDVLLANMEANVALYQGGEDRSFWIDDYIGNHFFISNLGMFAGAVALFDHSIETKQRVFAILDVVVPKMELAYRSLANDGSTAEGMAYFGYGMENLMLYNDLSDKYLNTDIYNTEEHFKKIHEYIDHMLLPENAWNLRRMVTQFADSTPYFFGQARAIFRKLASKYNDSNMQWLATRIDEVGNESKNVIWLNILWQDDSVTPKRVTGVPYKYFDDLGAVSSRSDWSGDESLFLFKCGPFLGHHAMQLRNSIDPTSDWGGAHAHPDANHFSVFFREWLLDDDTFFTKETSNHNTLVINVAGSFVGQYGEGATFIDRETTPPVEAIPTITKAETNENFDYTVGDASTGYKKNFVEKFVRHIVYLKKKNAVLVVDDIKQPNNETRKAELRFFTTPQNSKQQSDGSYTFNGFTSQLRLAAPAVGDVVPVIKNVNRFDAGKRAVPKQCIVINSNDNEWVNATAFSWSLRTETPENIIVEKVGGKIYRFIVEGETYTLNAETSTLTAVFDDDGDGVSNENDTCLNTIAGAVVDSNGCEIFSLPSKNFRFLSTGESCSESNNGSIMINAERELNYTATLSGDKSESKTFTGGIEFKDLVAGNYEVCITVENQPDFEACFNTEITEPEKLFVTADVQSSAKILNLQLSGASNYIIEINNERFLTTENNFSIELPEGENEVLVKTDKDCQGSFKQKIIIGEFEETIYPNPIISGNINLAINENIDTNVSVYVYDISGNLILETKRSVTNTNKIISFNADRLNSGLYFIQVDNGRHIRNFKIIKK